MKKMNGLGNHISEFEKQMPQGWVWDDTRAFLAVARHGTLSGAATELNLGIATLSRRIERLEKALKLPLFVRLQSGYQLTEEGSRLIAKAEALEIAAADFSSEVSVHEPLNGRVRLATAENLANGLILPALPEFCRQFPGITLELLTNSATVNLHRRDADLALRMVKPDSGHVTMRRLGSLGYGLYCSAEYVAQRVTYSDSGNYDNDRFIAWGDMETQLPAAQWIARALQGRAPVLTTTTLANQVVAAKAGLGLAVLPHFVTLNTGLICLDANIGIEQSIYLVVQSDLNHSRRIRAVADFLIDLVDLNQAVLSG